MSLVMVCDSDPVRARECAVARSVDRWFVDPVEAIRGSELDLLIVATPPVERIRIIEAAVARAIPAILCEKPVATSLDEASLIRDVVTGSRTILAINYVRRWAPVFGDLAELVPRLGRLESVIAHYSKGLLNNGSHMLDLLNGILGPPISARATGVVEDGRRADETLSGVLRYPGDAGNAVDVHLIGHDHRAIDLFELDLIGTEGRLTMRDRGNTIEVFDVGPDALYPHLQGLRALETRIQRLEPSLPRVLSQLMAVLDDGRMSPSCDLAHGVLALGVVEVLRESRANAEPDGAGPEVWLPQHFT